MIICFVVQRKGDIKLEYRCREIMIVLPIVMSSSSSSAEISSQLDMHLPQELQLPIVSMVP